MKKRRRKEFPSQTGVNRYYYPVPGRRSLMGISGMAGIDPALQVTENSYFDETDPQGSYTGATRDGGDSANDADIL